MVKKKKSPKNVLTQLEKTKKSISEAQRMGANVKKAVEMLLLAGKAIENNRESEAIKILDEIKSVIKKSKKSKRLETMIFNTLPAIEEAKKVGADVSGAEEELEKARKALEDENFGTAQQLINMARREADDAKRYVTTKELILEVAPILTSAKRRGVDITEPSQVLVQAYEALEKKNYGVVKRHIKDTKAVLKTAEEHKSFADSVMVVEERIKTIQEAGVDISDMEQPLIDAKEALAEKDYANVKKYVNKIKRNIDKIILQREAGLTIRTIRQFISQAKKAGLESTELEGILERASVALKNGNFSEMQGIEMDAKQIAKNLKLFDKLSTAEVSALDGEMVQSLGNWIQQEINDSKEMMHTAKERGVETSNVEELISTAETALAENNIKEAVRVVQDVRRTLDGGDISAQSTRVQNDIERLNIKMLEAKELGVDISQAEIELKEVLEMVGQGNLVGVDNIITKTDDNINEKVYSILDGKYPKINLSMSELGLESEKWNKCLIGISNTGSTIAKDVDLSFSGDVEVRGVEIIPRLAPEEMKEVEVAVKPLNTGKLSMEVSASYQRYFDETKYQLNDMKEIAVDEPSTYIVEDVFLIYKTGIMITKESRRVKEEMDSDVFSAMLTAVTQFIHDSFHLSTGEGLSRMEYGDNKLLIERGEHVFLALTILGEESAYLPFYMAEIIQEIEEKYGPALAVWTGEMSKLAGIEEIIKKMIFVKKDAKTEIPMLSTSILSPILTPVVEGKVNPDEISEIESKLAEVDGKMDAAEINLALKYMTEMKMIIETYSTTTTLDAESTISIGEEELKKRMYDLMIRTGGTVESTALLDERLNIYFELVGKISDAVYQAKEKSGIPNEQPLARVAILHPDYEKWQELLTNMKAILLDQLNTTDVELVKPGQCWSGLNIGVIINEPLIRESYKHIATNIISVLQFMPPEKMKSNVEKESFTIGVEGQQVYISKEMVSIKLSTPEGIIETDFEPGKLYIDPNITEEMAEESNIKLFMNAIILHIKHLRDKMELTDDAHIEVQIFVPDELAESLEKLKNEIASETNASTVEFPLDDSFESEEYQISKFTFQDEDISVGVALIEFAEE